MVMPVLPGATAAAAASSEAAEPYGLQNSPAGQLEQSPDMLQAWRRLSASIEALPEALEGPYHSDAITPAQLDNELAQLCHAQLAAGADAAQRSAAAFSAWPRGEISMTEAELTGTWGASADVEYALQLCKEILGGPWASFGSMWDASNSPCVLMGSPDQHYSATPGLEGDPVQAMGLPDELQQQYSLYLGLEPSIHLTGSPAQLWHDTASAVHSDPMQPAYPAEVTELSGEVHQQAWRYSAEDDVEPDSGDATSAAASPANTWQPADMAESPPDSPDPRGACEAALQQGREGRDRQQGHRQGFAQGFAQPSEEDLHAMMARFQQSCARAAPTPPSGSGDDLAAMSAPAGSSLPQQQAAAVCNDANKACQNWPDTPSSQMDPGAGSARLAVPSYSLRQVEAQGLEPAVPWDSPQPEEAESIEEAQDPTMEESMVRMARLATCSDDEEFAVLNLLAASDASSDCSFWRERTAAGEHETVYAGPR
jgi:hypothetical protein